MVPAFSAQFDSQLAVGGISNTGSGFGITFAGILDKALKMVWVPKVHS